ncbi:MAG: hypothetical protein RMJ44_06095 [Cytophagales bacterium]|nr:hypothetical protein [Bernardetiaceae bacterium]MDW8210640.1 hypothetical protein [Cytophagales bacterium]
MVRLLAVCLLLVMMQGHAQRIRIKDYYPLVIGARWTYTAPPGKPDYVSRIERGETSSAILHYDATNAAKVLRYDRGRGIFYGGEIFNDGSKVVFQKPFYWFTDRIKLGDSIYVSTPFQKYETDGRITEGTFTITQKVVALEDVTTTSGQLYPQCMRIDFSTHWVFEDGRQAQSINTYHFAKGIGPVKASARFIITSPQGEQIINRLVETDLKKFEIIRENENSHWHKPAQ